jgi:hypothetical protein
VGARAGVGVGGGAALCNLRLHATGI